MVASTLEIALQKFNSTFMGCKSHNFEAPDILMQEEGDLPTTHFLSYKTLHKFKIFLFVFK